MIAPREWYARFRQVDPDEQRAMIAAQRTENGAELLRRAGKTESEIREWREEHARYRADPVDVDD